MNTINIGEQIKITVENAVYAFRNGVPYNKYGLLEKLKNELESQGAKIIKNDFVKNLVNLDEYCPTAFDTVFEANIEFQELEACEEFRSYLLKRLKSQNIPNLLNLLKNIDLKWNGFEKFITEDGFVDLIKTNNVLALKHIFSFKEAYSYNRSYEIDLVRNYLFTSKPGELTADILNMLFERRYLSFDEYATLSSWNESWDKESILRQIESIENLSSSSLLIYLNKGSWLNLIKLAIEKGANPWFSENGETAIHVWARNNMFIAISMFAMRDGQDIYRMANLLNNKGMSPLMEAVRHQSHGVVRLLLNNGVDIWAINEKGESAAQFLEGNDKYSDLFYPQTDKDRKAKRQS